MIGQTISHYKITEKLGEGGMGVVYKAEDTKLERTVALKFLAAHLLNDEEAKARFLREARAAAGLHHPNICPVYEIDEADNRTFLSMAFIKGEALEARIEKGPLPLKEALDIGRQIAEGLEAAHEEGVVHRDIKPANVMTDAKGRATIMDFGLARLTEASRLTKADQTMGTAAYMSPEQAQGIDVDQRTDIWAFGVVLYEMVRGQRPFQGEYDQALLFEIVHQEPEPLTGVRTGVPPELEFIVGKCLAKDPSDRYDNAAEVSKDLRTVSEKLRSGQTRTFLSSPAQTGLATSPETQSRAVASRKTWKTYAPWVLFAASALIAVMLGLSSLNEQPERKAVRRWPLEVESLEDSTFRRVDASPNGAHIAYIAGGSLWVRDLDKETARLVADSARPGFCWSPDSRYIVYAEGEELKRIAVEGGVAAPVCTLPASLFVGSAWSPDGETIAIGSDRPPAIYTVAAAGGVPEPLFERFGNDEGQGNIPFSFLPANASSSTLLFGVGTPNHRVIYLHNLETGASQELLEGAHAIYSPTGHILYQTSPVAGGLWALPFSLDTLHATGPAFPVSETGGDFSLTTAGDLIYADVPADTLLQKLVWLGRDGKRLGEIGQPQIRIRFPSLSPDGRRVAVEAVAERGGLSDIWLHEVERPLAEPLTRSEGRESYPSWSPDGKEVTYRAAGPYRHRIDGTGSPELLFSSQYFTDESDWSPDGSRMIYTRRHSETRRDLMVVALEGKTDERESEPFLATRFAERAPQISPDGRRVAYCSDESGRYEVYTRDFPDGGNRERVSLQGGCQPRWSADGRELFFVAGESLMQWTTDSRDSAAVGEPKELFEHPDLSGSFWRYDVSSDGRFVIVESIGDDTGDRPVPTIHVVENWFEEFREREQN